MLETQGKPKVLAVDDYDANLIALQAVLGSDYELVFANSGREAISILLVNPDIDVILMDIQMPGMDGFTTASEIKKISWAKEIPIIFITAVYKEESFIKKGYEAGGFDYFTKPFDPDILRMKLSAYCSLRYRTKSLEIRERGLKETEELMNAGRKLSGVLEELPVGVLISDVEGRICQINDQVGRIYNKNQPMDPNHYGDMLGWWDQDGRLIAKNGPLWMALRQGVSSHKKRLKIPTSDGSYKFVLCSASPLTGLDGHIVGAVVMLHGTKESKTIEGKIEEHITRVVETGVQLEASMSAR